MNPTAPPKGPWATFAARPDYLTVLRDGWAQSMQQWVDQSTSAWDQWAQWSQGWAGAVPGPRGHPHGHEHLHHHARGCCGDACDCCVPQADVVVHARAGEVRVVPFRLANRWRREREVTLAVGPWQVCGGTRLEVRGVLDDEKVVLAPCEDRIVRLLITVNDQATPGGDATTPERRTIDVDDCASAYADVRFEGCSRPLRVAVVVSPGDCDPVDACCDCGCC